MKTISAKGVGRWARDLYWGAFAMYGLGLTVSFATDKTTALSGALEKLRARREPTKGTRHEYSERR